MISLQYSLPPEVNETGNETETITTGVKIEDARPEQIARKIQELHDQNYDVAVSLRLKEPK